jgi:hypothetical protein
VNSAVGLTGGAGGLGGGGSGDGTNSAVPTAGTNGTGGGGGGAGGSGATGGGSSDWAGGARLDSHSHARADCNAGDTQSARDWKKVPEGAPRAVDLLLDTSKDSRDSRG